MSRVHLKPLHDQVMVITGASSGIGLATARMAAERGARVFLIARGGGALAAIVAELQAKGFEADHAEADVGDRDALERAFDAATARFGRIDTVVSDAGAAIYSDILATPRDEHERLFRTNYWGAVNTMELAVPRLTSGGGGALLVVGSIASDMGTPVMGAYAATKHAVKGYVDSLRIELHRDRVPVVLTLVKPAGIATPLDEHVTTHMGGAARVPPPAYAPEVVAATLLRAAVRPFRELTVGSVGEMQILFATHFPGLFSRLAGGLTPVLTVKDKAQGADGNLEGPTTGGATGTRRAAQGRTFSVYTAAATHPGLAAAAALAAGLVVAGALGAASRRRRRWPDRAMEALDGLGRRLRR